MRGRISFFFVFSQTLLGLDDERRTMPLPTILFPDFFCVFPVVSPTDWAIFERNRCGMLVLQLHSSLCVHRFQGDPNPTNAMRNLTWEERRKKKEKKTYKDLRMKNKILSVHFLFPKERDPLCKESSVAGS
mmetsp:Transcript_34193/g.88281  ORF Transcript_34193/g.88281 Transcript_34193/m.88281 type:complete len:131 (+) Transcript_34193:2023-2415(+)